MQNETACAVFSVCRQHDERSAIGLRRADRHDATLRGHEPLAFVQRERRERGVVAEPGQRMIAEDELQCTFDRDDRTAGAQVVQGHLTGGKMRRRGAIQFGTG
ncbi:hypothetical protein OKW40_001261 [Paraburkholderia sp. RAU6.4a]|uniref:hypothetical protein n=1 Tax=Paraburkholderia sp. RAU6.4a TaxID=2991067 RepID=UPI003D23FAED